MKFCIKVQWVASKALRRMNNNCCLTKLSKQVVFPSFEIKQLERKKNGDGNKPALSFCCISLSLYACWNSLKIPLTSLFSGHRPVHAGPDILPHPLMPLKIDHYLIIYYLF